MNEMFSVLLQAVALNDTDTARKCAKELCISHQREMPPEMFQWIMPKFESKPEQAPLTAESIPPEVASLIEFEDVKNTFNPRRYWVSSRERPLLDEIINLNKGVPILQKAGIPFLNSTLLWGESGVGKTQFGRYLAYSLDLPFIYVNLSNLSQAELGGTSRNLRKIFDFVNVTPCLFMLDELDAIGANRGSYAKGGSGDEMTRTTIALMQCLDIVRRDAIILAATNRSDMLDAAVLRRFSIQHELQAFLPEELTAMADSYLTDVKETGELDIEWSESELQRECQMGRSQANIINLCNRAVIRAVLSGERQLHLTEESLNDF